MPNSTDLTEGRVPWPSVSLVGLGAMGLPMARILAAAGPLTVWNRTPREVPGARRAGALADAMADVVITVLPDIDDVRDVLLGSAARPGLLAGAAARAVSPIVVVCGTVSPVAVRALAAEMTEHGVTIVDAPLSGGVLGAAEGRLSIMVGGSEQDFAVVRSVLEPCAARITLMGPTGAGAATKLCNQIVVAETVVALSEAFALARSEGIDPEKLADALGSGLAASEVLQQKRRHWIEESFEPGGTVAYQVKDLGYAAEMARAGGLALPALAAADALFRRSMDAGDGSLDHTGVYRVIARAE